MKCFDDESMCRGIIEEKAFRPCGGLRDTKIDKKRLITTEQLVIVSIADFGCVISAKHRLNKYTKTQHYFLENQKVE